MNKWKNYVLEEKIFEYKYGNLWKAKRLNRNYLIEIFSTEISNNLQIKPRFERVIKDLFYLTHANIAQLIDVDYFEERYYLTYEIEESFSLTEIFKKVGNSIFPLNAACYIALQLCEALDYAHTRSYPSGDSLNLIHGAISPSKILITRKGHILLFDFNILPTITIKSPSYIYGENGYLTPDHFSTNLLSKESDIFCLGILLYRLLTGDLPFSDQKNWTQWNAQEITLKYDSETIIPDKFKEIIGKCLKIDPKERYSSVDELQKDLTFAISQNKLFLSRKGVTNLFHVIKKGDTSHLDFLPEVEKQVSSQKASHDVKIQTNPQEKKENIPNFNEKEISDLISINIISSAETDIPREDIKEEEFDQKEEVTNVATQKLESTKLETLKSDTDAGAETDTNTNTDTDTNTDREIKTDGTPTQEIKETEQLYKEHSLDIFFDTFVDTSEDEELKFEENGIWGRFVNQCIKKRENPNNVKYLYGDSSQAHLQVDLLHILEELVNSLYNESILCMDHINNEIKIQELEDNRNEYEKEWDKYKQIFHEINDKFTEEEKPKHIIDNLEFLKNGLNNMVDDIKRKKSQEYQIKISEFLEINNRFSEKTIKNLEPLLKMFPLPLKDFVFYLKKPQNYSSLIVVFKHKLSSEFHLKLDKSFPDKIKELSTNVEIIIAQKKRLLLKGWSYDKIKLDDFTIEELSINRNRALIQINNISSGGNDRLAVEYVYSQEDTELKKNNINLYNISNEKKLSKIEVTQDDITIKELINFHNKIMAIIERNLVNGELELQSILYDEKQIKSPSEIERCFLKICTYYSPSLQDLIAKSTSQQEISLKIENKNFRREEKYIPRKPIQDKVSEIPSSWKYLIHLIGFGGG